MKPSEFNLRTLRVLAETVRLGSLSAGARAVRISQPAASQAVQRLEALLGTELLDRSGGGAVATDAGLLLAARAKAALAVIGKQIPPEVTMAQLTALLALADHGSYSAGAETLGFAQPTLHRAVAELERASGLTLVERRGRGTVLTAAGEGLAASTRIAMGELQAALDELAILSGRDQGSIRLGAEPACLDRLVTSALARFLAEHPPVRVDVQEVEGQDGAERLRDGRIDLLLTARMDGPGLVQTSLVEDPYVIAARTGHPLLSGSPPGAARLAQSSWAVLPRGHEGRAAWEQFFLTAGLFPPSPSVTFPHIPVLAEIAGSTDLLTIAPRRVAAASGLREIGPPLAPNHRILLVTRRGWAPTPAQATFVEELRAAATTGTRLAF